VAVAAISCGASVDCPDAQSCAYLAVMNGCSLIGQCRTIVTPDDISRCTPAALVCPCSGETQQVPPCWGEYSPVAVQSLGACPPDGGPDAIVLHHDAGLEGHGDGG
jgi:hypothetical protein